MKRERKSPAIPFIIVTKQDVTALPGIGETVSLMFGASFCLVVPKI